jgi:hypothetical protein
MTATSYEAQLDALLWKFAGRPYWQTLALWRLHGR